MRKPKNVTEEKIIKDIEMRLNYISNENVRYIIGYCKGILSQPARENGME